MAEVKTPIYLDYQATTPLDERALEAMMPYLTARFGNPHSVTHRFGWEAMAAIDVAREQVASVIGAEPAEITFLSGATEANNLAIKGVMEAYRGKKDHLITVATEHKCVLESARAVERAGARLTILPVGPDGLLDLDELARALTPQTALVSVMAVNNEIGVIQPLAEIGELCREHDVLFHCDAAQAYGKIPLDAAALGIGLMSLSAHKIYGPKGIGALYVRAAPRVPLVSQISGGGQERGLRSGTLAPALCVGFGRAAAIAAEEGAADTARIEALSRRFREAVLAAHPDTIVNGSLEDRYPGNLNLAFPGVDGDLLIAKLKGLAVSSGAACASAETGPSYVLQAIGLDPELAHSSLRIGFGRLTSEAEADYAAAELTDVLGEIRGGGARAARG